MEMWTRELLPILRDIPVLFGLFASDPFISLYDYLKHIKACGFSGIVNFPTLALIDGNFQKALEAEGNTFEQEVEAIKLAHYLNFFTVGFVTDEEQTSKMLHAGADIICVHLGLTKGGFLGAKKYLSIEEARRITDKIFKICQNVRPEAIRMIYSGPANTPIDMQYIYQNTTCQGYIGGSTFDRIPTERAIINTMKAFKSYGVFSDTDPMHQILTGQVGAIDYVQFVKDYIEEHYATEVKLGDLALFAHISSSYLSTKFKKELGCSFTEYLIRFRMNKAKKLLTESKLSCKEAAQRVGYSDYAQFAKIFKKYVGMNPTQVTKDARAE